MQEEAQGLMAREGEGGFPETEGDVRLAHGHQSRRTGPLTVSLQKSRTQRDGVPEQPPGHLRRAADDAWGHAYSADQIFPLDMKDRLSIMTMGIGVATSALMRGGGWAGADG